MLYSCTPMATVGVKGFTKLDSHCERAQRRHKPSDVHYTHITHTVTDAINQSNILRRFSTDTHLMVIYAKESSRSSELQDRLYQSTGVNYLELS